MRARVTIEKGMSDTRVVEKSIIKDTFLVGYDWK